MNAVWDRFFNVVVPAGEVVIAIAEIYVDETGTHETSPVMGVAAYVFAKDQAEKFSKEWQKHLTDANLPFFHMTDCATGNGHYEMWSLEDKIAHEKYLISLVKETAMFGVCICMSADCYTGLVKEQDKGLKISAYSHMLGVVLNKACIKLHEAGFIGSVSFFLEKGHVFQNEAIGLLDIVTTQFPERYFSANYAFIGKGDAPPLQAADLLAWLTRNAMMKANEGKPVRRDFMALMSAKDEIGFLDEECLIGAVKILSGQDPGKGPGRRQLDLIWPD